jgi:hypothetical protein
MFDPGRHSLEFKDSVMNVGMLQMFNAVMGRFDSLHDTFRAPPIGPYGSMVEFVVVGQHCQDGRTGQPYDDILLMTPATLQARLERGAAPGERLTARPVRLLASMLERLDIGTQLHEGLESSALDPARQVRAIMQDISFPPPGSTDSRFTHMVSVSLDATTDSIDINDTPLETVFDMERELSSGDSVFTTLYSVTDQIAQGQPVIL